MVSIPYQNTEQRPTTYHPARSNSPVTPPPTPNSPRRILLIRPSALGDVCRTVPVLVSLKRAFPGAEVDWLVQDSFAAAVAHHPDLNDVVPFPRAALSRWLSSPAVFRRAMAFLGDLRRCRYDLVVDCQGLLRSGLFTLATRAPARVGYSNAEELGWLGYNRRVSVPRTMHTVDRMLALAEHAGAPPIRDMRLYPPPEERERVAHDPELAGRRFAVLAPTSRWPGKRWPIERFAELARAMLGGGPAGFDAVVVVGSKGEREQCGPLLALGGGSGAGPSPRLLDRVGATSVGGLMALIERASLVVANDSAALHMAVGLDRPAVGLYGPTDLSLVGPYRRDGCAIQHITPGDDLDHKNEPAGRALMERITVEEVLTRVAALAAGESRPDAAEAHGHV